MPSWNVHIAHALRVLNKHPKQDLGIHNEQAFVFGCLLPDLYVGYMVKPLTKKIAYMKTHFADPSQVPLPDYDRFETEFVPHDKALYAREHPQDVLLGAWCHLMADHTYNAATRVFLAEHHIPRGERARIGKQGDLDLFGKTMDIDIHIELAQALIQQCRAFKQYEIDIDDVRRACEVVDGIVASNKREHIYGHPHYAMLNQEFFDTTFERVHYLMEQKLLEYAQKRYS